MTRRCAAPPHAMVDTLKDSRAAAATGLESHGPPEEEVEAVSERLDALELSPRRRGRLRPAWRTCLKRPTNWLKGMPRVGFVYDKVMLQHSLPGHVERPGRLVVPYQKLEREGTLGRCFHLVSRRARREELETVHTAKHVERVFEGTFDVDEDLYWSGDGSKESAVCSVGCTLQATEAVLHGALDSAFALVRPPGHHAEKEVAQGFCFFNNVAIAAMKAKESAAACKRVLIVDWDVHHGNGTQTCFYADPSVLYISLHRGGNFYPGTGKMKEIGSGDGYGYNVNVAWPGSGFGDADYLAAFECIVQPLVRSFGPDLILVSAGFDAVVHDPLGGLEVTPACFAHLTQRLLKLNSRTVLVLEGGYNILQLAECVNNCVKVLLGDAPKPLNAMKKMQAQTESILRSVAGELSVVWPTLALNEFDKRLDAFREGI